MTAVLAGCLAFGLALVGLDLAGVHLPDLLGDPSLVSDSPWWTGSISLIGLLLWAGTAGMLLLTGLVVLEGGERERALFFLTFAALVGWLALDDAVLLHEEVLPDEIGVPRFGVIVLYGVVAAGWALRFRRHLTRRVGLLGLAVGGFVLSLLLDHADEVPGLEPGYRTAVAEDYAKYVGVGALMTWVLIEARRELLGVQRAATLGREPED